MTMEREEKTFLRALSYVMVAFVLMVWALWILAPSAAPPGAAPPTAEAITAGPGAAPAAEDDIPAGVPADTPPLLEKQFTAMAQLPLVENGFEIVGPTARKPLQPAPGQRYLDTTLNTYSIWNGASWLAVNTSSGIGVIDDIGDVEIIDAQLGDFLGWDGTRWTDRTILLDALGDVTVTAPADGNTIRYNGSGWVNSDLAATDLSDVSLTSLADNQFLRWDSSTSKIINETVDLPEDLRYFVVTEYGAVAGDGTDDTATIQAAIDAAEAYVLATTGAEAIVDFPRGVYICEGVEIAADLITLQGAGTLKLKAASAADSVLLVSGDYNRIEGITIDGNAAGSPSGRGEGLRVTGDYNIVSGVTSQNTKTTGSTGATFFDNNGTGNTFEDCYSFSSGYTAFRMGGEYMTVRNCYAIDHLSHGLGTAGNDLDSLDVDGFYSTGGPDSSSFSGILVDNGKSGTTGYMVRNLSLKNIVINAGADGYVPLKIARTHNAYLENVQAIHSSSASSLKLAEDVGKIVIRDSYLSRVIDQDPSPNDATGAVGTISSNGGFAKFTSASHGLVTNAYIVITGTTSYNGLHLVTAVGSGVFTTNRKFVTGSEAESGNFYSAAGEISVENVTVGDRVHNVAGALSGIRAHRLFVDRCDFRNYREFAIGLDDDLSSTTVFDKVTIKDTRFESNDTNSQPWVLAWDVGSGTATGQILDTNVVYMDDGLEIVDVGSQATRGATGKGRSGYRPVFDVTRELYGAKGDGTTNDTTAIQAALTAAALIPGSQVVIPEGTYSVTGVVLGGTNVTLTGPGTLKLRSGSTTNACLRLANARHCRVVGVNIDGGRDSAHTGNANAFQIDTTSTHNTLEDCYATNTYLSTGVTTGRGFEIQGDYNTLTRPRAYDCDRQGLHISKEANDTRVYDMSIVSIGLTNGATQGVRAVGDEGNGSLFHGGIIDQSAVSFDASLLGHAAFLHDPDSPDITTHSAMIDVTVSAGNGDDGDSGCSAIKYARCEEIFLQGVKVYCNEEYASVRFAEACQRIHLKGLRCDTQIFKENTLDTDDGPEWFHAEDCHLNINETHRADYGFEDLRAQRIRIDRCQSFGRIFALMDIDDDNLTLATFDDNHLMGGAVGPLTNIFITVNDVATMLKTSGKYIYLPNNRITQLDTGLNYTGPTPAKRQLLTTVDETGRIFEQAAIPVATDVNWRIGDIIRNTTTPAPGVPEKWICKVDGAGGTADQFQAIYPFGTLASSVADAGNVGSGFDNLITYSLPANTLTADGAAIEIEAGFTLAANANDKDIEVYLGATNLLTLTKAAQNGGTYYVRILVVRDTASSSKVTVHGQRNGGSGAPLADISGQVFVQAVDWTSSLTINGSAEGTSNNDIVQEYLRVRSFPPQP
jgi:hypothetical protein